MNRRQKLVQQQFLHNEKTVIKRLEYIYDQSLTDINKKIRELEFHIGDLTEEYDWLEDDDPKKEVIRSKIQSKIYQKQYQESLQDQVGGILKQMQSKQYLTIADYLDGCYEDSFIGSIFDLHGQGVPLLMPLDQTKMVRAVQLESKISKGLYTRLGEDVTTLKKRITAEVTRSIATGSSYAQCAQRLAGQTKIGYNKAVRIVRTEGHRIQTTAAMDVMHGAKERGADVLKQWDAALDDRTRESHVAVDGEIREVDEPFSNGLMFPGDPAGGAAEVVNCRCALLQRARWALKEKTDPDTGEVTWEDGQFTKWDGGGNKLVDFSGADDYNTFKKKYMKVMAEPAPIPTPTPASVVDLPSLRSELRTLKLDIARVKDDIRIAQRSLYYGGDKDAINARVAELQKKLDDLNAQVKTKGKVLVENMNTTFKVPTGNDDFISLIMELDSKIEYKEVMELASGRTFDEIIQALAGGDNTQGSCASVGLGYIGQKNGWDVLDFRDGVSRDWFGGKVNKLDMWKSMGVSYMTEDSGKSNLTNAKRILARMEKGKEYYLSAGGHASIVRKNADGVLQYLELQHPNDSGWHDFGDIGETLKWRFGCSSSSRYYSTVYLTDIDGVANSPEFRTILGYINTSESMQRKGKYGQIR